MKPSGPVHEYIPVPIAFNSKVAPGHKGELLKAIVGGAGITVTKTSSTTGLPQSKPTVTSYSVVVVGLAVGFETFKAESVELGVQANELPLGSAANCTFSPSHICWSCIGTSTGSSKQIVCSLEAPPVLEVKP